MAKKSKNLFDQYKYVIIGIVVVLAIISLYSLTSDKEVVVVPSDLDITSKIPGVTAEDITCVYLGNTAKYGHFAQYAGQVLNEGDETVNDVKVVVDFFDASNKKVGTHETLIVGGDIGPDSIKRFFSYTEEGNLSAEFETCKASIEQ